MNYRARLAVLERARAPAPLHRPDNALKNGSERFSAKMPAGGPVTRAKNRSDPFLTLSAVPEPSALALSAAGLLVLLGRMAWKRRGRP